MSHAPGPGELILAPRCCRLLCQNTCPGPTQPRHCQSPAAPPEPCLSFPIAACREGSGGALGRVPAAVPPANESAQPWQHSRIRTHPKWKDASPPCPVAGHNPDTTRSDPGKVPGPDPILRQPPPRGGSSASPSSRCHPARGRAALRGNQILKSAHLELAGLSPSRTPAAPAALQSEAEALTGRDSRAGQRLLTCHLPPSGAAVARGGACGGDTLSPCPGPALGGAGASRSPSGEILGQNPGGEEPAPKWAAAGCAGSPGAGTNGVSGAVGAPGPAFRQGCAASCPRHF